MDTTNVTAGGVLLLCSAIIAVGSGTIEASLPVLGVAASAVGLSLIGVLVEITTSSQSY